MGSTLFYLVAAGLMLMAARTLRRDWYPDQAD
jgi:hypothetical protein